MDYAAAAEAIRSAKALLVAAGAGMGVDSGLPDFRGDQGFWKAYPPYQKLGLSFVSLANPAWFDRDPALAWGFYGHRLELYRRTVPHAGFDILRRWATRMAHGAFVFTSNVDGQFQRAGFAEEEICEAHGAIDWLQCTRACAAGIFTAQGTSIRIDEETMRAVGDLPHCPRCGELARPNILMFGDGAWDSSRTDAQRKREWTWLQSLGEAELVIVECGSGSAVPTVRMHSENLLARGGVKLIRLNPREPEVPAGQLGLPVGALEGLRAIDALLGS